MDEIKLPRETVQAVRNALAGIVSAAEGNHLVARDPDYIEGRGAYVAVQSVIAALSRLDAALAVPVEVRGWRANVMQPWLSDLTLMQQSVLLAAIRGPDGIRKDHVAKLLLRWLRRCVLLSAFDGAALLRPDTLGGGSFTGPSMAATDGSWTAAMTTVVSDYLRTLDELPHHFQLHLMHAAEILGYRHPDPETRGWWHGTYLRLVNDMHLLPESAEAMGRRLGDKEADWRAAEEVIAASPSAAIPPAAGVGEELSLRPPYDLEACAWYIEKQDWSAAQAGPMNRVFLALRWASKALAGKSAGPTTGEVDYLALADRCARLAPDVEDMPFNAECALEEAAVALRNAAGEHGGLRTRALEAEQRAAEVERLAAEVKRTRGLYHAQGSGGYRDHLARHIEAIEALCAALPTTEAGHGA